MIIKEAREQVYNTLVNCIRKVENNSRYPEGYWPGMEVGQPAHSLYPNIAAELFYSKWRTDTTSSAIGVTRKILVAVIEDGETLSFAEGMRFYNRLGIHAQDIRVTTDYVFSPVLSFLMPGNNKYQLRKREFFNLLDEFGAIAGHEGSAAFEANIGWVADAFKEDCPMLWASYAHAVSDMKFQLRIERSDRAAIRGERMNSSPHTTSQRRRVHAGVSA